ncbi:MAG: TerC family protein [Bdellovibrionales bacterium]|nr:TerC family protein [Bdellovibrionales bacterium]
MDFIGLDSLAALAALIGLEIVLGIDNIVFLAILVEKLPKTQQAKARFIGLGLAMIFRILLLLSIKWLMLLEDPLFSIFDFEFSGRKIVLLLGGLFLIWKATMETHKNLEGDSAEVQVPKNRGNFWSIIVQIVLIDILFSLDSVITAVGMVDEIWIMISAIVISIIIMLGFAKLISDTISKHPTLRMLAIAFIMLIGVMLVAEGFGKHFDRAYLYFAMGFSLFVEVLNIRIRAKKLKQSRS